MRKLIILLVPLILLACNKDKPASPSAPPPPQSHHIQYCVYGSPGPMFVQYLNSYGGLVQLSDIHTPWSVSLTMLDGAHLQLIAQNDLAGGTVEVRIYKDSVAWKAAQSEGVMVIAAIDCVL